MTSKPHPVDNPPDDDATEDPAVDPLDAAFPSSPELDDENTDARSGEPGASAG